MISLFAFSCRALKYSICPVSSRSNNDDSDIPASPRIRRPIVSFEADGEYIFQGDLLIHALLRFGGRVCLIRVEGLIHEVLLE